MIYQYECVDDPSDRIELIRPMAKPPKLTVRRKGKTYRRVFQLPGIAVKGPATGAKGYVSWNIDPYHPMAPRHLDVPGLPKGICAFESQRERQEFEAKTKDSNCPYVLDP